jgi:hypothetical protein
MTMRDPLSEACVMPRNRAWLSSQTLGQREPSRRQAMTVALGCSVSRSTLSSWRPLESINRRFMGRAGCLQCSDRALNWLTDNAVITTEQRTNAAAILRRISDWLERAAAHK